MKFPRLFFLVFLFFLSSCGNQPATTTVKVKQKEKMIQKQEEVFKSGIVFGVEVSKGSKTPYDDMFGKRGDTLFICSYKGKMDITDTLGKNRLSIFDINAEFIIAKIYIIPLSEKRWFLSWQETDHEGVKSFAGVFKTNEKKPLWKITYRVPNPGIPVLDGQFVYATYLGVATKINVDDGKVIWQRDSLFNTITEPFKKFERPRVFENKIEFVDYPNPGHREKRDTLRVDPSTGEGIK